MKRTAEDVLKKAIDVRQARSEIYGDKVSCVGELVTVLFPQGIPEDIIFTNEWFIFESILNKLARFAATGMKHQDSIDDAVVYCAMLSAETYNREIQRIGIKPPPLIEEIPPIKPIKPKSLSQIKDEQYEYARSRFPRSEKGNDNEPTPCDDI